MTDVHVHHFHKFFYSQTALLSIHPRSESAMVRINPNPNPIRNPILNVATVKRTFPSRQCWLPVCR